MNTSKHTLFVCTHATPGTRGGSLVKTLSAQWDQQGISHEMTDLTAIGFNPVAGPNDFSVRPNGHFNYREEQKKAAATRGFADDIALEQKKLEHAEMLVLCFPMWVFGMPAIMKGWIERVFARGVTYGKGMEYETGGMAGKVAGAIITAAGAEEDYLPGGKHEPMENILRTVVDLPLSYMGFSVKSAKVICNVESYSEVAFGEKCREASTILLNELIASPSNTTRSSMLDWRI